MSRVSKARISRLEEAASAMLQKQRHKRRELLKKQRLAAKYHATCVAAIVLAGEPKFEEPLCCAWNRALQHFDIKVKNPNEFTGQIQAAHLLDWYILAGKDRKERFTELFKPTPAWLLEFTRICFDSLLLDFNLPSVTRAREQIWGVHGLREARGWPTLPVGTMGSGNPLLKSDYVADIESGMLGAATFFRTEEKQVSSPRYKDFLITEDL